MARSWGLHAIVLAIVLTVSFTALAVLVTDRIGYGLILGLVAIPMAGVYAALSTLLLVMLRPGRRAVAIAHGLALTLAMLVQLLFITRSPP